MKEYEKMNEFPRCGESHYKLKENGSDDDDGVIRKGPRGKMM